MRAVAYCRFSSEQQRDGFSIEAQLAAIKDYCDREGIDLVDHYIDEAKSGTNAERANFQRMVANASTRTFDLVIVHKLDRFSRDRYDFAVYRKLLRDHGVALRSVIERIDDSPESIILEGMLESMAEYYSKNLARETMKGLKVRARQGLACSNRPFGYDIVEGRFVLNEANAVIVREIFGRVISGESLASIARSLEQRGIRGSRGAVFSYPSLQKIIRNTIYYGDYTFGGEVVASAAAAPILDMETWAAANARLDSHRNRAYRRIKAEEYLLTGILYCGVCGGHYSGHCSHGKKKIYRRYRCTNATKRKCDASVVNKEKLEAFVIEMIEIDLYGTRFISSMTEQLKDRLKRRSKVSDFTKIKKELNSLKAKNERLLDLYLDASITKNQYVTRATEMGEKIKVLEAQLKAARASDAFVSEEVMRAALKYYFETIKQKNPDSLARFINSLVERITLDPGCVSIIYKFKDSSGNLIKSSSECALNANSGGPWLRLSAHYRIDSYRDLVFDANNLIEYKLLD